MKITAKQYALSLYESLKGKDKKHASEITKKFFDVLAANNQTGKINAIIEQFVSIWNKENGLVEARVVSSKKMDADTAKHVGAYIKHLSGAKEVSIDQVVDENILGGIVVRFGDQVIDASLKTKISSLKEEMVK